MSNKNHGKEVASTSHLTKQHSRRPSQITCYSQPIAFPSIDSSYRTSQFAPPPLAKTVQSTNSHSTPMDERPNLGSNESNSTSNETSVASELHDNGVKPILNLDGQGCVY